MTAAVTGRPLPLQLAENGCDDLEEMDKSPVAGPGPKPITVKKTKVYYSIDVLTVLSRTFKSNDTRFAILTIITLTAAITSL